MKFELDDNKPRNLLYTVADMKKIQATLKSAPNNMDIEKSVLPLIFNFHEFL